jgi:putative hemolysin
VEEGRREEDGSVSLALAFCFEKGGGKRKNSTRKG